MRVEWSQSTPSMDTLIITTEQEYNKARGSHVTKRGYTEVLAKPTKYSISPITSNNHCIALMQGFFSLCHISLSPVRESGRWTNVSSSAGSCDNILQLLRAN